MKHLTLGFIPLLDCATLVAAAECGHAAREGLDLALVRETSWANIRDRVIVGHFQAAHMLGPMAVASTLGIGHLTVPMIAPMSLGLGGNAITVSAALWKEMAACGAQSGGGPKSLGAALKKVIVARAACGLPLLTFAMVYPFSCHNYELRYWLAACGIDPDRDVHLVVIPPPFLVDALREGRVDGFCVGEPWNSLAAEAGAGRVLMAANAIWNLAPEKVLGCRADWAAAHPDELAALVRALYQAALWCDQPEHHEELARLLARPGYVGVSAEILQRVLSGILPLAAAAPEAPPADVTRTRELMVFARHHATFPWISHAQWFYGQMVRWGQILPTDEAAAAARSTYRPDLYRTALAGVAGLPMEDSRQEKGFFDTSGAM